MWKASLSLLILLTAVSLKAEVQFDRVNGAMEVITNAVVFNDDQVEYAKPKFDEAFSNLKAEKLRYSISGQIKNTPWLTGTKTDIDGSCTLMGVREAIRTGIEVSSQVQVKTDVLAMMRQGAITALKNLYGVPEKFDARLKELLRQMSLVSSLNDLYPLLLEGRKLGAEMINHEFTRRSEYLACMKSGNCEKDNPNLQDLIKHYENMVADYKRMQATYEATEIKAVPSNENVQKIHLMNNDPFGFTKQHKFDSDGALEAKSVKATLEPTMLTNETVGFILRDKEKLDRMHERLETTLVELQSGDLDMKEKTFREFRRALIIFKEVISGDWPKHRP